MRKIEKEIIKAIHEKKTVNLSERDRIEVNSDSLTFILWNSEIFRINYKERNFNFSFCGYSTKTTKDRINLCLSYFFTCCCVMLNDKIPFFIDEKGIKKQINLNDVYIVDYNGKLL
jgi:hypothetical protein